METTHAATSVNEEAPQTTEVVHKKGNKKKKMAMKGSKEGARNATKKKKAKVIQASPKKGTPTAEKDATPKKAKAKAKQGETVQPKKKARLAEEDKAKTVKRKAAGTNVDHEHGGDEDKNKTVRLGGIPQLPALPDFGFWR